MSEENRIIQNLPRAIEDSDLEYLKVRCTREVLFKCIEYFQKISPQLGFSYDDLSQSMGFGEKKYPDEMVELAAEWQEADEAKKEEIRKNNPALKISDLEEIINENIERGKRLASLPVNLLKLWSENRDKVNSIMDEAYDILELALRVDREVLKETDLQILVEIFLRIFFKPKEAHRNTFLLNLIKLALKAFIPIFNFLEPENLMKLIKQKTESLDSD